MTSNQSHRLEDYQSLRSFLKDAPSEITRYYVEKATVPVRHVFIGTTMQDPILRKSNNSTP